MNYIAEATQDLPSIVIPSISSSALLVTLNRSTPALKKIDKQVTKEVTKAKHASDKAGAFHKNLISSSIHEALIGQSNAIYTYHARNTVEWIAKGPKLLPNEKYTDYDNTMRSMVRDFDALGVEFIAEYPRIVAEAQLHQGEMFKESDYPSVEVLRSKIGIELAYEPIPDTGDFRIDIGNQAATEMQAGYNKLLQDRLQKAMSSVIERLIPPLTNMSTMLDYGAHEKKKGFKDTLVDNVVDIIGLIKTCNITNDPIIEDIHRQLTNTLNGVTPDALREDPYLRLQTKQTVDKIIKTLPSLGW
jgi:hypothetical protein